MEAHDLGEEGLGHRFCRIRVSKRDEVAILAEAVDHRENDRFAANFGQCLDEIQAYVGPHRRGHRQWTEEASRV